MAARTRKKATFQPPYALAMVICDAIWKDPGSGKRTILGCFSTILAQKFPASHPILAVYVAVTDGHGKVPLSLRLVDAKDDENTLFSADGEGQFPDPRAVLELDFHIPGLVFPEPGEYRFQLWAGDEMLITRRLAVTQIPLPPSPARPTEEQP
jgi:hypothetical protein